MKTFLTIAAGLLMTGVFAQVTVSNLYCIDVVNRKTVVVHDNKIITGAVHIDSVTQLQDNGMVIWRDKSTTTLRPGDCIDEMGIIYSERNETDFTGDTNALNHIHLLPEVAVTGERIIKTPSALNVSEGKNYVLYMEELYKEFKVNDYDISLIKEKMHIKTGKEMTKFRKALRYLEDVNTELKIDFDAFVHYGVLEDWHLFREEMNEYLGVLKEDIAFVKGKLENNTFKNEHLTAALKRTMNQ